MRSITVIYDGSSYTYKWLKALFWAKKEFYAKGYKIKYLSIFDFLPCKYNEKLEGIKLFLSLLRKYDIVFLAFHHGISKLGSDATYRKKYLTKLRKHVKYLYWLDTADSTGTCLFDVIKYVDLYFKKQLLLDTQLYANSMYCGRITSQYYYEKFGIQDDSFNNKNYDILEEEDIKKLRVAWNIAFYDYVGGTKKVILRPNKIDFPKVVRNDFKDRTIDIHFGGSNYKVYGENIGYQRKYLLEYIDRLLSKTHPDVYKKIPRDEYLTELGNSKSIISPFGWGEVCLRDFEAFIFGATLLKPSMEHLITYPNIYIPNETYIPINWDFSNLVEVVNNIGSEKYIEIANRGQAEYIKYCHSEKARELFVEHMIHQFS